MSKPFWQMTKSRVWCYFCNKSFEDELRLIAHQKMMHFRCPICKRLRQSTKALASHMSSAHREELLKVPNAIEGRDAPDNNVFGMKGIPENIYIEWLSSIDPDFGQRHELSLEGAVMANDTTRFAVMTHMASQANITYNQYNQFQRANVHVNQGLGTVLTAKGVVSADSLQKEEQKFIPDDPATAQRKYEIAMRKARELLDDAMEKYIEERKEKVKRQKQHEEMYFTPTDGLSVFEMRANYLRQQLQKEGGSLCNIR